MDKIKDARIIWKSMQESPLSAKWCQLLCSPIVVGLVPIQWLLTSWLFVQPWPGWASLLGMELDPGLL